MSIRARRRRGSIMPGYPWMYDDALELSHIEGKIITLRRLGRAISGRLRAAGRSRPARAGGARLPTV